MIEDLIFLPKSASYIILVMLLAAGIYEFRHSYIGRIGIFVNSLILWQIFFPAFNTLHPLFQWYLNIGTIIGIIAILSYLLKEKLPTEFYQVCFILYGSISIIIILIVSIISNN